MPNELSHPESRRNEEESQVLEVRMDYCFVNDGRTEGPTIPVLVLKDRNTKAVAAHSVPYKGEHRLGCTTVRARPAKVGLRWGLGAQE